MLDLTQGQFVKHVVMHPFEGFEDLRWKKSGDMKIATVIIVLLFFQQLAYNRLYGFQYYSDYDKVFNILPYFFRSIISGAMYISVPAMVALDVFSNFLAVPKSPSLYVPLPETRIFCGLMSR